MFDESLIIITEDSTNLRNAYTDVLYVKVFRQLCWR